MLVISQCCIAQWVHMGYSEGSEVSYKLPYLDRQENTIKVWLRAIPGLKQYKKPKPPVESRTLALYEIDLDSKQVRMLKYTTYNSKEEIVDKSEPSFKEDMDYPEPGSTRGLLLFRLQQIEQ